ncbi:arrestin domain-containing protein 17 [Drosophila sulfurigaster albostrigata]|uniref:arrestin domain-containing protein 17 n=1 Tax=Drosophila nasuta TaxID=42062 RepID=UPI00295E6261|nr:arrestin domain-containing protein 17 [Drosophila nasuta]XP_062124378.1 arrestin domain-containing protein 17 [Drosophila sulfurigaster albostrigata]
MVVTCDISFDNNKDGTFYAGQLVTGCVTLKSDKIKEVQAALVKVVGYSITKWSERKMASTNLFAGREEYLSSQTYLLGSEQSNDRHAIQAGVHNYNFACQLPYQCPSSFEGRYGCIRYIVKVLLIRPWKFDQAYTHGITVLKMMDLNTETPQLKRTAHSENYRTFCCGPCKTEPIKMELNLPQAGYVPGQRIPVTVVVINNSNVAVSELRLSLVMLVRYFSLTPEHSRVDRIVISKAKGDSILRQSTRSLTIDMDVPSTPPTCVALCNLIQIAYHLEVEAVIKSLREKQLITMPITIGTFPLAVATENGVVRQQPPRRSGRYELPENELPVVRAISSELRQDSRDIAPPKYVESKHTLRGNINEEELHAFGLNEFAPLYPVYSIPSPAPVISPNSQNIGFVNQSFEK